MLSGVITVLYFAAAREAAGRQREQLEFDARTVADLRRLLSERHPALEPVLSRCRFAVQSELVEDDAPLPEGAEVAVVPPVSGGAGVFRVVDGPLSLAEVVEAVRGTDMGAVVTFSGDVRGETRGKKVVRLEYEAYRPMAEKKLEEIGLDVERTHGVRVAIAHRVGLLQPGETAVVIACAASHRAPAFRACQETIERLKKEVPIWKKEIFEDGAVWVGMGP
jgi:MoaE-MoaD fusion protein